MAEFRALQTWAGELLRKLDPTQQRRLLTHIARELRRTNSQRMRAQQDPQGAAWEPRKPPSAQLRSRKELLRQQTKQKQPMFAKLRQAKYLKARATPNAAVVEFAGRAQRIAAVHHFGLIDAVNPGGPRYRYPARELIGIAEPDLHAVRDALLDHLRA